MSRHLLIAQASARLARSSNCNLVDGQRDCQDPSSPTGQIVVSTYHVGCLSAVLTRLGLSGQRWLVSAPCGSGAASGPAVLVGQPKPSHRPVHGHSGSFDYDWAQVDLWAEHMRITKLYVPPRRTVGVPPPARWRGPTPTRWTGACRQVARHQRTVRASGRPPTSSAANGGASIAWLATSLIRPPAPIARRLPTCQEVCTAGPTVAPPTSRFICASSSHLVVDR